MVRSPNPTIYDVARLAGVSTSTVSRALTRPGRITPQTERRVRDAAATLGYRMNPSARALPTGRTDAFAIVVSDITNPVYFEFVRGAQRVGTEAGCMLIFAESESSTGGELESAQRLLPSVDGLVLIGSRLSDDDILHLSERKPVVLADRRAPGIPDVVSDVGPGIDAALSHLADAGHRSFVYLGGPEHSWMTRHRAELLRGSAQRIGLSMTEIGPGRPTRAGGFTQAPQVFAVGATAVVAFNDLMAIGFLDACTEHGIAVPGQLSVIGFDDIFGCDFVTPPLTTIRAPLDSAGAFAIRALLEARGTHPSSTRPTLLSELIARRSTAPLTPHHSGTGKRVRMSPNRSITRA